MGLQHLFRNPTAKALDFLMAYRLFDYSIKDITGGSGVSFRTIQRVLPSLVKNGLVLKTRREGRAQMYMINFNSPVVKKLEDLAMTADLQYARSLARKPAAVKPDITRELLRQFNPLTAH
ncbi:hypothetical protein HYS54_01535 [Candidatus Micrarchaeota archaeon]|nr:hypothetical protein [Candidatus Micrarchaeota archaeon]